MKKAIISIAAICIFICFGHVSHAKDEYIEGPIHAHVLQVYDGDTFLARVPIWLGQEITTRIRIKGIDTAEMNAKCDAERRQAEAARDRLIALIDGKDIILKNVEYGKYAGRVLADVETLNGLDITTILMQEKLARPYDGGHRVGWC